MPVPGPFQGGWVCPEGEQVQQRKDTRGIGIPEGSGYTREDRYTRGGYTRGRGGRYTRGQGKGVGKFTHPSPGHGTWDIHHTRYCI